MPFGPAQKILGHVKGQGISNVFSLFNLKRNPVFTKIPFRKYFLEKNVCKKNFNFETFC